MSDDITIPREKVKQFTDTIDALKEERRRHRRHIRTLRNQITWQARSFHSTLYAFRNIRTAADRLWIAKAIEQIETARNEGDIHAAVRILKNFLEPGRG